MPGIWDRQIGYTPDTDIGILDRISFGFTAEKDNGEEFFKGSQPNGFDFYSSHVFFKNFGNVKRLALGDFQAQFGGGLFGNKIPSL